MFRTIAEAIIQVKSQKYGVLRATIVKPNIVSISYRLKKSVSLKGGQSDKGRQ